MDIIVCHPHTHSVSRDVTPRHIICSHTSDALDLWLDLLAHEAIPYHRHNHPHSLWFTTDNGRARLYARSNGQGRLVKLAPPTLVRQHVFSSPL